MKTKNLSCLLTGMLALFVSTSYSQFKETMGATFTGGAVPINSYTGFVVTTVSYSGTGDVRSTVPSSGYPGASAGGNVLLQAQEYFTVSNIDASSCATSDMISFGINKNTNPSTGVDYLVLEYSADNGSTWTSIPYAPLPSGVSWYSRSVFMPAAACVSNLIIRFRSTLVGTSSANPQFRIDDVQMTCGN